MLDLKPIKDLIPVLKELTAEVRGLRADILILTALLQESHTIHPIAPSPNERKVKRIFVPTSRLED